MKSFSLIVLALIIIVISASAQKTNILNENCYKTFTGTIAGQPVIMQWRNMNGRLHLNYNYVKHGQDIQLYYVPDSSQEGQLFFSEGLNDADKAIGFPIWKCRYGQGRLEGIWYSANRKKQYSIHLNEGYPEDVISFTSKSIDTTIYLFLNDTAVDFSYNLELSVPIALPNGRKRTVWLNHQIYQLMKFKQNEPIEKAIKAWVDTNAQEYQSMSEKAKKDKDYPPSWTWDLENNLDVAYNQHGFVILSQNGYQFSGGAHGSSWQLYSCFDIKMQKTLLLSDIITVDSAVLQGLLENQFRKDYHLKPTDSLTDYLFENLLMANQNFSFDGSGLYFTYNQYEIAPYVMGIITLMIPWKELKQYLRPDFAKRMVLAL